MKRLKRHLWLALFIVSITSIALSQGAAACPAIVQTALDSTREMCSGISRNQACYGNVMLEAQPQPGTENFTFDSVGDLADTASIANLRLSSLDEAASQWGVALMEIQASIPDAMPQNVTLLMFGNVQIDNVALDFPDVEMRALTNVNIRRNPSLEGAVIDSADAGTTVIADGRLDDNSWIRLRLPHDAIGFGWIYGGGLDGDLDSLAVVQPDEPRFGPMQAFMLETGVDDAPCADVPSSGLLIQTPEGVGEIRVWLNQVSVRLGSTVYFQAQRGGDMTISVLEGHAVVNAMHQVRYVPQGAQIEIPMSETLAPEAAPSEPHAYNSATFAALTPTVATLPRQVEVSQPIAEPQLAYYVDLNDRINNPRPTNSSNPASNGSPANSGSGASGGSDGSNGGEVVTTVGTTANNPNTDPNTTANTVNTVLDTTNTAVQSTTGTVDTVLDTTNNVVQSTTNTVDNTVDTVANTANQAVDTVLGQDGVVDNVTDIVPGGDAVDAVVNEVADTTNEVVDTVSDTVDTVTDTVDNTVDQVTDTTSDTVDTVSDTVDDTVDTVTDVVNETPLGGLLGHH